MMDYVLDTNALCKSYKKAAVLKGVDMHIPKGAIYGFVGRNGAGKTTLIRVITGLQAPTAGSYRLYGAECGTKAIAEERRRMGAVVEVPSIYMEMTAQENLKQQFTALGMPDNNGIDELLHLVGLSDTGNKKAKHFSLGMRQRLGIAVALAGNPDFLVLDEPINGLDPQGIVEIRELILKLNREMGITVLISSHILDELSRLATHYGFISNGQIVKEISAAELEQTCRRYTHIAVSSIQPLLQYLDKHKLEYTVTAVDAVNVFGNFDVNDAVPALLPQGCRITAISQNEESLESYFINLVGGNDND